MTPVKNEFGESAFQIFPSLMYSMCVVLQDTCGFQIVAG